MYLAFLLYHDDKVLVTYDDFLPVIEVDENYPRKIQNDFHWFFKVIKSIITFFSLLNYRLVTFFINFIGCL